MKVEALKDWVETNEKIDSGNGDNIDVFIADNEPADFDQSRKFREQFCNALSDAENNTVSKILSRLNAIFTDYKNTGFENGAEVTKIIMNEIKIIVKE